jgi:hypothetical protein
LGRPGQFLTSYYLNKFSEKDEMVLDTVLSLPHHFATALKAFRSALRRGENPKTKLTTGRLPLARHHRAHHLMTTSTRMIGLLALAASLTVAQAQVTTQVSAATPPAVAPPAAPPPPPLSPTEQTLQDIKNPVPWMSWGGDMRIREEYFDNLLTLNPDDAANLHLQNYLRFRGRIWTSIKPIASEDLSLNVRLVDEVREWLRPAGYTAFSPNSGLDWRFGIFDQLNVRWKNILQQPATLTVGRQDIFLGDGWLVGDGTPGDGSWTYFLDAGRLAYELKEQHTTVEVIGIYQNAQPDAWLPTIEQNQFAPLTEQNEVGAILWVGNKSVQEANVDGYFMYKRDNALDDLPFGTSLGRKFRPDNADIYTLGARISGLVSEHWKYSAEGAYQFGQKQDPSIQFPSSSMEWRDLSAFGFNGKASYLFKDRLNNQLGFSYEFLSGDDPNTPDDEMFDNLWGRWPRWSEIGLYSYAAETRIGNEANIHRFGPTWSIDPIKNINFSAAYYALFSEESVATRGAPGLFTGTGNFRGHFVQGVLKYKLGKHVNAHLWAEFEFPGDYYVHQDMWFFLRPEIMFTF